MSDKFHYFCYICNDHLTGKEGLVKHKSDKAEEHKTFLASKGGKLRTYIVNMPAPEAVPRSKKNTKKTKKSPKKAMKQKYNNPKPQHSVIVPDIREFYHPAYECVTPVWEPTYEPMVILPPSGPQPRFVYLAGF